MPRGARMGGRSVERRARSAVHPRRNDLELLSNRTADPELSNQSPTARCRSPKPDPCSRNRKNGVAAEVTRPENPVHLSSRLLTSAATVDCMATAKSLRCHVDRASSTCRLRHFSEFSGTVSVTAAIRVTAGSRTTSRKATTTRTAPRPPSLGIHNASSYQRPVNSGLFGSRERQRADGSPFAGARGYPTNQSLNLLGD